MTIADCSLLGQSTSGLNFYDDIGRIPQGLKAFIPSFSPPLADYNYSLWNDDDAPSLLNDNAQLCAPLTFSLVHLPPPLPCMNTYRSIPDTLRAQGFGNWRKKISTSSMAFENFWQNLKNAFF
jgi:hypothetical protein